MNPQHEELACLYVLDRLDPGERAAFEARVFHDPQLAAVQREFEIAFSRQIKALPQHEPPFGMLARIEARIDRTPAGEAPGPGRTARQPWPWVARWGIAVALAVATGMVGVQGLRRTLAEAERTFVIVGLEPHQGALSKIPTQGRPQTADARFIQLASLAEQFWENPGRLPVKVSPSGRGYALFDPDSNQGFIAIRQLAAAHEGLRYHLWVLDSLSGRIREAGVLPLTGAAHGLFFFSVAPASGVEPEHLGFFITAEDASEANPDHPRGEVVLGDKTI